MAVSPTSLSRVLTIGGRHNSPDSDGIVAWMTKLSMRLRQATMQSQTLELAVSLGRPRKLIKLVIQSWHRWKKYTHLLAGVTFSSALTTTATCQASTSFTVDTGCKSKQRITSLMSQVTTMESGAHSASRPWKTSMSGSWETPSCVVGTTSTTMQTRVWDSCLSLAQASRPPKQPLPHPLQRSQT